MARDINSRLTDLQRRRSGVDRLDKLTVDGKSEVLAKSLVAERWQQRQHNKPHTRYALGAMQEVGPDYTRISLETAQRIGNQLQQGLTANGFSIAFRLQGSVPLNVHIRGVSDVDLLNLDTSFLTYATYGRSGIAGIYTPTAKTSLGTIQALRAKSEQILKDKFPAARVDCTGGKAINISGGSLARPVDVVPSHWNDTIEYQNSGQEHDRGVTIMDRKVPCTEDNLPFLHIKRIDEVDAATLGGMKKAIRLCKNVKSDSDRSIALPSFDIASIMYHANRTALISGSRFELSILAETQRHLDYLYSNQEYAKTLRVPDGSRVIFDKPEKLAALFSLSCEMDELTRDVAKEQDYLLHYRGNLPLSESRSTISSKNLLNN